MLFYYLTLQTPHPELTQLGNFLFTTETYINYTSPTGTMKALGLETKHPLYHDI